MPALLRARLARAAVAAGLIATALLPGAGAVHAADPVVLRVGTTQDLDSTNPWNTYLVVGYEVFQLNYNLLTEFDKDAKPAPGFAESWERSPDKVTFKIRSGMKWSDGQPANSQDVCYSWGLAMAAIKDDTNVGAGYLDPNIKDAGVTKIECPDDDTFVATTSDQSDRIYQVYVPILPKHVFGKDDYKKIADEKFNPPLVGTGPYILKEWKTGQFARFERNPDYWGNKGFADQVEIHFYKNSDTMVQALKSGELDYAHGVNPDQFNQLKSDSTYGTTAGKANGWTQLAFNTYGTGTGKTIKNGGPSTKALLDAKFRDALGYAVDKKALVDRVLAGYGDAGTTNIPPSLSDWHVEPDKPRTFDIEKAKQLLTDAGYPLDSNNKRLDKEGKPIKLRLYMPDSDENYPKAAQFIKTWYGELGIDVVTQVFTSAALGTLILPPEGESTAKYDIELWGWAGSPDPNALLQIFRCDAIGGTSDSQYCNKDFDALYDQQLKEAGDTRKTTLAKIQNLIYDEAPYDILYYDSNLDVWRTDKFAGWQNMPSNGTPLFTYGVLDYTLLSDVKAAPSAAPSTAPGAASGGASAATSPAPATSTPGSTSSSGNNTVLIVVVAGLVVLAIAGALLMNRRRTVREDDE
ncbi:MAG TPA: ABC transporter substrate-binding protein [Candidatus Limnocylindrales bacterium]|nr:ABC transporter substrate-binding protein [Candidatus Limnocylindrales bacterium]